MKNKYHFLRGSPLLLAPGRDIRSYVEDYWSDTPRDVRISAKEDIDGAVVEDGKMLLRVNCLVDEYLVQYFHAVENHYTEIAGKCSELVISLNTYGGIVTDGFEIVDMMAEWNRKRDVKVSVLGAGAVYSMGIMILQAAFRRYSYPNAEYLIHPLSGLALGTREQIEDHLNSMKAHEARCVSLICRRSGLSEHDVRELMRHDSFLSAERAHELGLIDEIAAESGNEEDEQENEGGVWQPQEKNRRARELRAMEMLIF